MSLALSARLSSALLIAALALGACGGSSQPAATTTPTPVAAAAADPTCPVEVPGTSVSVEDTTTGAAMVFVTTGDVAELRTRVAAMATKHNEHHGAMGALPDGTGGGGAHAGHDMHGGGGHAGHDMGGGGAHAGHDMSGKHGGGHSGGMIMMHSRAEAADIEGGIKVTFTVAPADVAKIQAELRMHAQHLAGGSCAMKHS